MRTAPLAANILLFVASAFVVGCGFEGPRLAVPSTRANNANQAAQPEPRKFAAKPQARKAPRYHGKTAEQWSQTLQTTELEKKNQAGRALHILGSEGRPFLIQGLEDSNPETRRVCLEALTVSELRAAGDQGRQLLVKLAGDPMDIRIRERAGLYLSQWNRAAPAR